MNEPMWRAFMRYGVAGPFNANDAVEGKSFMDPSTAISVALIAAVGGLVSGLVVAYLKPFAEDRALAVRERRARRKEHLDRMWDVLLDGSPPTRVMIPLAAAIGDATLLGHIEQYLAGTDSEDRAIAINHARSRLGELMRDG